MKTFDPTKPQLKVLEDTSSRLLVSASAGSGKTATIIQKIFNLVKGGEVDLGELLVITFTEAASMEMKVRLKSKLYDAQAKDSTLSKQIEKLPTSDICTLHAFCSKMIRRYFYKLDLNPNFVVLDENNSKFLKANALEKVISNYSNNNDEDFLTLTQILNGGRSFSALKSCILGLYDFLCAVPNAEEYKQNVATLCYDEDFSKNKACQILNDYLLSCVYYLNQSLKDFRLKAEASQAEFFKDFIDKMLVSLSGVTYERGFVANRRVILVAEFPKLTNKKLSEGDSRFKEIFRPFLDEARTLLGDLKDLVLTGEEPQLKSDLVGSRKIVKKLIEVENSFEKEYIALKQRRNALDFADLEDKFLELLEISEVRNSIAKTYKYIFVDEYQDINSVQEKILSKITLENKMVMVGDIKQSIYGFRNSSPEIFVNKSLAYKEKLLDGTLINLNENFRSSPQILEFVNAIFEKCMFIDFGGVDYAGTGCLKGKTKYKKVNDLETVELNLIDTKKPDSDEDETTEEFNGVYSVSEDKNHYDKKLTRARREALVVAKKILGMVGKHYYLPDEDTTKEISYGDIAILCRSNDFLKEVSNVLVEYKIPVTISSADNIYKNQDVMALLSILRLVNNFHDDISLTTALTGFFGGFTFDDLTLIRNRFPDEEFFYESFLKYADSDEGALCQKSADFIKKIQKIRKNRVFLSIFDILNDLQREYDFLNYFKSLPDGKTRYSLLTNFIDSFNGAEFNWDLNKYLDFVDNYASEAKFSTAVNLSPDSVRLGTIHSSKGLEYPIVFLVGCGKTFSVETFKSEVLKDKDLGLGINAFNMETYEKSSTLARSAINLSLKKQERAEELRLLYVALTRAKNNLIIVGHCNLSKLRRIRSSKDSAVTNSFMPWIASMLTDLNFSNLVQNKASFRQVDKDFEVAVNVLADKDFEAKPQPEVQIFFDKPNEENTGELLRLFNYKFEKNNNLALKNTVSSMLQEHSDDTSSLNFEPQKLVVSESKKEDVDAAKLGTIYHKVMQKLDLMRDNSLSDIEEVIKQINFDDRYKKLVSRQKIKTCLDQIKSLDMFSCQKELPFLSYMPYNSIFKESPYQDKILIQGVADLVVKCRDKTILVDYKTTRASKPDLLVEKYRVQLTLYKICLEKALDIKIDQVFVYSFFLDRFVEIV